VASEDEIRPVVQWYVDALTAAGQAIHDGEDVGQVIRDAVDGLSENQAKNVLQVMIAHQAQQALKDGKRQWN
jgi:hypothetical protein